MNNNSNNVIDYTVNDEAQSTTEKILTPINIMSSAGVDTDTNYLVQIRGNNQVSYQDNPEEQIQMHEKIKFITIFTGPVPVA